MPSMRILHTSDWHLGQFFLRQKREAEHAAFLDWLCQQAITRDVDAVLVCGDVFDTASPGSYARKLYADTVARLRQHKIGVVVLAGNHDSVAVMQENQALLQAAGAHVVSQAGLEGQVFTLPTKQGQPGAVVCAVPFVRQGQLLEGQADESELERSARFRTRLKEHYASLYAQAQELSQGRLPIVGTGHLTTWGSKKLESHEAGEGTPSTPEVMPAEVATSEAMRDITVGTLRHIPLSDFPRFDYFALGHIHKPLSFQGWAYYSGAPIPLAFDEAGYKQQVLEVTFTEASTTPTVVPLLVPRTQDLLTLSGTLSELATRFKQLARAYTPEHPAWLSVSVSDLAAGLNASTEVDKLAQGLPLMVLRTQLDRPPGERAPWQQEVRSLHDLGPLEVFEARLAQEDSLSDEDAVALRTRFERLLAEVDA